MTSRFPPFGFVELVSPYNKKNITRWLEDMNFMFSWQEQYLTRSLRSLVRYCSCHENIKFISSRHHVISSMYNAVCGAIPQNHVLSSIVLGWILIYQNWCIMQKSLIVMGTPTYMFCLTVHVGSKRTTSSWFCCIHLQWKQSQKNRHCLWFAWKFSWKFIGPFQVLIVTKSFCFLFEITCNRCLCE